MSDQTPRASMNSDTPQWVCAAMHTPPQLPHPADAVEVDGWRNTDRDDPTVLPFRMFTGRTWTVPAAHDDSAGWELGGNDTRVTIEGVQFSNGRIKRWVEISGDIALLPPESVGALAEMLLSARNEMVRLNGADIFAPVFSHGVAQ